MLIGVLIVAGIALLSKGAKTVVEKAKAQGQAGQYSETGMAAMKTHKPDIAEGSPVFTPSNQRSAFKAGIPFQLVGMDSADPSVGIVRTGFNRFSLLTG